MWKSNSEEFDVIVIVSLFVRLAVYYFIFVAGVGFGLMYTPSLIMIGLYFDKRRALATGIAMCGAGIGTFVIAPLGEILIETYSWRGAVWILAGICLNCVICGIILRPIRIINTYIKETSPPARDSGNKCADHVGDVDQTEIKLGISKDMLQLNSSNDMLSIELTQTEISFGSLTCDALQLHPDITKTLACQWVCDKKQVMFYTDIEEYRNKASDSISNYISSITAIPSKAVPRARIWRPCYNALWKSAKQKFISKFGTTLALFKQPAFCIYELSSFLAILGKY